MIRRIYDVFFKKKKVDITYQNACSVYSKKRLDETFLISTQNICFKGNTENNHITGKRYPSMIT